MLLALVTLLPALTGLSGLIYLDGAALLGASFLYYAIRLPNPPDELFSMKVFNYSIIYLIALFLPASRPLAGRANGAAGSTL